MVLPEPPNRLTLVFTETIEPSFPEALMLGVDGQPVHTTTAEASVDRLSLALPLPPLPDGSYPVTWSALSTVDEHPTRGFYGLTNGQAAPVAATPPPTAINARPPDWVEATIRWLVFAGQAVLVGGLLFVVVVLTPTRARLLEAKEDVFDPMNQQVTRVVAAAVGMLVVGSIGALLAQAMTIQGGSLLDVIGAPLARVIVASQPFLSLWGPRFAPDGRSILFTGAARRGDAAPDVTFNRAGTRA